jgi:UDP-N-acetylglucosamine diphosphorylase/glucosamine-1-phosphate N-acetyltransferase
MVIVLFDTKTKQNLYPLAQTCSIADIRFGILSIKERWEIISGLPVYVYSENYLSALYEPAPQDEYLLIDASLKDEDALRTRILSLQTGETIIDKHGLIAGRMKGNLSSFKNDAPEDSFNRIFKAENVQRLEFPWQIVFWNDEQLRKDFLLLLAGSQTKEISETNKTIQPENIIIEENAVTEHCIINASTGPVYIGKNVTIMEGSMLRGPVAICEGAIVKMGAKIYGSTTVGPYCSVGGEIKNSVLQSCSNKAHDGYLGDAAIGSWCNLGAGTSNSNVKNSGAGINVWNKSSGKKINMGKKFGFIMGDYSRTAINTSINSGSVIGICCNIFGEGLTPDIIEDFTWGMNSDSIYKFEKAVEHISNWKEMKKQKLSSAEISVLKYIFDCKLNDVQRTESISLSGTTQQ